MFKNIISKVWEAITKAVRAVWARRRKIMAVAFTALSVFCGVYWLLCGIFAGFGISALWVWVLLCLFFGAVALWYGEKRPFRRLRRVKWLRRAVAIFLCICALYFAVIESLVISGMASAGEPELDYIIVLGAKVNGTRPSLALRCRIDRAYEYLTENSGTLAVLSGGQGNGEDISEAEAMRRGLVERGISPQRLILEARSTSTEENLKFSYELIPQNASVGIVTNNFHVWRAVRAASAQGKTTSGISASYPNVLLLHYMMREFLSITFYALTGKI